MRRARPLLWILAFVALVAAPAAHATSVTVQMTGTWFATDDSAGVLDGSADVGDTFVVTLVYDDAVADSDPTSGFGAYFTPAANSDLTIATGNYTFSPGSSVGIGVEDDNAFGEDWTFVDASSYTASGPFPIGVGTGATAYSTITLVDYSSAAHSSEALVGLNWSLAAFDDTDVYLFIEITGQGPMQFIEFEGTISQISVLPEPSVLLLGGFALVALAGVRRG
jgi:hypothetical protein